MFKKVAPLSILLLQLLHLSLQVQSSAVHYVKAEGGEPCPTATPSTSLCQQLDFYMANASFYFASNTTLYFLAGEHVMLQSMVAVSVSNLTLQGLGSIDHDEYGVLPSAVISCTTPHSLVFLHSFNITVTGLAIKGCGGPLDDFLSIQNSILYGSSLALGFIEMVGLDIREVSIQNSTGYGLLAINALDANIMNSSFAKNNIHCATGDLYTDTANCLGGNVAMHYTNLFDCASLAAGGIYELNILHTNISLGYSHVHYSSSSPLYFSGGLVINLDHSPIYGMDVVLKDMVMYGNTRANMAFTVTPLVTYYTLTIDSFKSTHSDMVYLPRSEINFLGGGLLLYLGRRLDSTIYKLCGRAPLERATKSISITNINLSENYGDLGSGGLNIVKETNVLEDNVTVRNAIIAHNIGFTGIGIQIFVNSVVVNTRTFCLFQNVTIINNSASYHYGNDSFYPSAIFAISATRITLEGVRVLHNEGTGFMVINSLLIVRDTNNLIKGNHGNFGGGMSLEANTNILFDLPAKLTFIDNHAETKGGAIFVAKSAFLLDACSFDIPLSNTNPIGDSGFYFTNNTANIAGSILYGGDVDTCFVSNFPNVFSQLYHVVEHDENDISTISSNPINVCFCSEDGVPDCSIDAIDRVGLPGSNVIVSIAIVGQRSGTTPGTLQVKEFVENVKVDEFFESHDDSVCHDYIHFLRLYQNNNMNFSPAQGSTILNLSAVISSAISYEQSLLAHSITVSITIMECPLGFELSQSLGVCDCNRIFQDLQPECNIIAEEISRDGDAWLGYDEDGDCLIGHDKCPFDYCDTSMVTFTINNTDPQCNLNRQGLLCGECEEGLTLLLGSNRCGECSNSHLALLSLFMLAGIALVALIIVLNLTVSQGTINDLIFVANVVVLAEPHFFPHGPIPVLSQFISWINLDFGIETCFFVRLNGYYKVWLQYVFPFYIWLVILAMIYLAKYRHFSRLLGRQAIPVLSTLILLSYTKLFCTITLSLHSITINCGDGTLPLAWYADPNVKYFSLEHSILLGFSFLVLIFLVLPYTILLLFNPIIEKHTSNVMKCESFQKCFQAVWQRLKPFLDAYNGPYKDETRFWTGLLLFTRLIIILTTALSNKQEIISPTIMLLLVILFAISMSAGGIYKNQYCNALGSWYLLLLAVMSCAVAADYAYIGTIVGLSLTLLTFICVLIYHIYLRVNKSDRVTHFIKKRLLSVDATGAGANTFSTEKTTEALDVRQKFNNVPSTELCRRETLIFDDDTHVTNITVNTSTTTSREVF